MRNNISVYHVFNAKQIHLVPGFISQFQEIGARYNIPTYFLLCNYSPKYYEKYSKLIDQVGTDKFEFVEDSWGAFIYKMSKLTGDRKNQFIIHGIYVKLWMSLSTFLAFRAKRFSWVCWGSGIEDNGTFQTALKSRLYNSFRKINCLMSCDMNDLTTRFKVKDRTHLIPYVSNYDLQELGHITPYFPRDKVNILVGHRATAYLNHLELLERLSAYADKDIRIVCFLNYGSDDKEYIRQVMEKGKALFGEKFVPITTLLNKEEYEGVMKSIDITLIAGKKQAGLGAIYRTILYKGAVFLDDDGKNMEWLRYMNVRAINIGDIGRLPYEELVESVSVQQKDENQHRFLDFVNKDRLLGQWRDFILGD